MSRDYIHRSSSSSSSSSSSKRKDQDLMKLMMGDFDVEVNDGNSSELFVLFNGPSDSKIDYILYYIYIYTYSYI